MDNLALETFLSISFLTLLLGTSGHAEEVTLPAFLESVTLPSGAQYDGQLIKGIPNGRGQLLNANGDQYDGVFVDGKFEGRGVFHWVNGNVYKGKWSQGKRQGFGSMQYANGNHYEGEWLAGKRHGQQAIQKFPHSQATQRHLGANGLSFSKSKI